MEKQYTLLTGASQGLGKAMTFELAQRGENLMLVALPESGLEDLSSFIKQNYAVDVHYLEIDLSETGSYYEILGYIEKFNIQLKYIINNAGVLSRGLFEELDDRFIHDQIMVNVTAPTMLIRLLLNNLKRNSPAGILNVSSLASFFPLPKKQVYCASKAYLSSFSKSLRKELKKDNISVSVVSPGSLNTTTKLCCQNKKLGWLNRQSVLDPESVAKIAIDGMLTGKKEIIPGFINNCFVKIDKILPEYIEDRLTNNEIKKIESLS
ncbi:MAG: SDR family NAD(P)-dependent oxidoreductase [Aureibaculum sp.]